MSEPRPGAPVSATATEVAAAATWWSIPGARGKLRRSMDLALVSCLALPEPDPDAVPLGDALDEAGIDWRVLAWDDPDADWAAAEMTLFRSSWNYPLHRERFLDWAAATARVTTLYNSLEVTRWNSHKSYLLALAERGIPIAPTVLVPRHGRLGLAEIAREHGFGEVVIKPAVSAASFRTRRFARAEYAAGDEHLRALAAERDVLVQHYLPSVEDHGERALVWIDGRLTHAVRKTPRFEGERESVSAAVAISAAERQLAERVMSVLEWPLFYGRIDVAPGRDGRPVVMELELIEPSLFFAQCPDALARFVAGIERRLEMLRSRHR